MTILLDGTNGVTTAGITLGSTAIASTGAELNILDGVTSTAAELNILDGVTSTTAELNILDGVTSTAAELNILDGVTSTAAELNLIDGGTARGTTALADGDGILINDAGTMRMSTVQTVKTYMTDGVGGGGTEFIASSGVVSDVAVVAFTQFDSSKYDSYTFKLYSVKPATNNQQFFVQTSTDGGSNFNTTNGDYHFNTETDGIGIYIASAVTVGSGSTNYGVYGDFQLYEPHRTDRYTFGVWLGLIMTSANRVIIAAQDYAAGFRVANEDTDAVRFLFASGNIASGEIVMYGHVKA